MQCGEANFSSAWVLEVRTALAARHGCQSLDRILTFCLKTDATLSQYHHSASVCTWSRIPTMLAHRELIFIADNKWIHFSPTSYLFLLIHPGGLTMALAGHQCWSFIPLHTGLVLTPLAKFTDLTDCGLNAACLVFSTCPSRFATLAAQFLPILIIHQLVMPAPGRLP